MRPVTDHRNKCPETGKLMFPDKRRARALILRLEDRAAIAARRRMKGRRPPPPAEVLVVYRCPFCRAFHVGHRN